MKGQWYMGTRNLLRNRRRSLATGLSIAIGFAGLMFTFGYIVRIEHYLKVAQVYLGHTGHLMVYREQGLEKHLVKPDQYSLSRDDRAAVGAVLAADGNVERFAPYLVATGLLSNGCTTVPYRAVGIDPETEAWIYRRPEVLAATPELARFEKGRGLWEYGHVDGPVSLSLGLARLAHKPRVLDEVGGGTAGEPMVLDCEAADVDTRIRSDANVQLVSGTFSGDFGALDAEVVSEFTTGFTEFEDVTVLARLEDLQRLHDTDKVSYIAVFLREPARIERQARDLEARLRARGLEVSVYPWNDARISPNYTGVLQILKVLGGFIFTVMFSVVGLSIINSMTMAVIERRQELGTLRALGFTPPHILRLLLCEVLVLAFLGVGTGYLLGSMAAFAVNSLDLRISPPATAGTIQFMVTPSVSWCLLTGSLVLVLAVIATVVAARRGLQERIVTLLYGASG